ncbi:MAG TPA: STAS domain-containing protein [Acidimicrobiales bacterium]
MAADPHYEIHVANLDPDPAAGADAGEGPVVVVRGDVDIDAVDALWDCIERARARSPRLVLDLSGTRFMDSSGLEVLVRAVAAGGPAPGAVVVRSPVPQVMRLLKLTGVDQLVTVERPPRGTAPGG